MIAPDADPVEALESEEVQLALDPSEPSDVLATTEELSCSPTVSTSQVVDWNAKITAAREKFQASSARVREALKKFDEVLIKPMSERDLLHVTLPVEADKSELRPEVCYAQTRVLFTTVFGTNSTQETVAPVEFASASVSVVGPHGCAVASTAAASPVASSVSASVCAGSEKPQIAVCVQMCEESDQPLWPLPEETSKRQEEVCRIRGELTEAVKGRKQFKRFGRKQRM